MLKITATRLRKQDRRRAAILGLFRRLDDKDYTKIGDEPLNRFFDSVHTPVLEIWLAYAWTIDCYAWLCRKPDDDRLVAVTIDRMTLIFDQNMETYAGPCAVLFRPLPEFAEANYARGYGYQSLVTQMTGPQTWNSISRLGNELRSGGFLHVGSMPASRHGEHPAKYIWPLANLARTDN